MGIWRYASRQEREMVRVLGKEKGREMGAAIFVDNLGIGPGNVPATPREEEKGKGWVRAGGGQANLGLVKVMVKALEVKVLVRERVKVLGAKVHVSIAIKLDIKQQSARMLELLMLRRLGQKSLRFWLVVLR